jgi:hypothetical protein
VHGVVLVVKELGLLNVRSGVALPPPHGTECTRRRSAHCALL